MPVKTLQQAGYAVVKELGRGSQGIAKLATSREGMQVCVKCLERAQMSASALEELQEEFQTLQQLSCERVAQVFELFQDAQFYYMVGEPYHGGDLMTLKSRAQAQGVATTEQWFKGIFRQCLDGIAFMHEQAMMHCDIKEPNIMLKTANFNHPEIVLIDFGVSRAMAAKQNGMPGGTPGYIPPETLDTRAWFPRGDIFSMGVTIMQVMTDKIPPTGARTIHTPGGIFVEGCLTIQDIMQATKTREPPFHLMPSTMPQLTSILRRMLSKQMQARPTGPQVLKDSWFRVAGEAQPAVLRSRKSWATVGITKSFLARKSVAAGEDLPPAIAAMLEVQRSMSKGSGLSQPATQEVRRSVSMGRGCLLATPEAASALTGFGKVIAPAVSTPSVVGRPAMAGGRTGSSPYPSPPSQHRPKAISPVRRQVVFAS